MNEKEVVKNEAVKKEDGIFKTKLAKLIDVKTIITFALTAVFTAMSLRGDVNLEMFMTVYVSVITYFFAKNLSSKDNTKEGE